MFSSILIFVHVFVCLVIIGLVMLQQGKGANLGASFGGGGDSFFGATGADNVITRVTTIAAMVFMATSLLLSISYRSSAVPTDTRLIDSIPDVEQVPPQSADTTQESASQGVNEEIAHEDAGESSDAISEDNLPLSDTEAAPSQGVAAVVTSEQLQENTETSAEDARPPE